MTIQDTQLFKHYVWGSTGSVIGRTLFLIQINDIVNDNNSIVTLFADDASINLSLIDANQRTKRLNNELKPWSKKKGDTAKRHNMFLVGNVHPVNPNSVFLIINSRQYSSCHFQICSVCIQHDYCCEVFDLTHVRFGQYTAYPEV